MRNWSESLRNWFEGLASGYAVDHLLYLRSASFEVNVEFTLTHASSRHSEERPSKASFPLRQQIFAAFLGLSRVDIHLVSYPLDLRSAHIPVLGVVLCLR